MSSLYNRARVATATAGTGTMTLGAATSAAFFTFAEAGVPDGTVVSYVIEDGTNVELGVGTYTSSGTTLSRTVTASKISGTAGTTKLTLSGSAVVYIDALAADITVPPASSTDNALVRYDGTTGRAIQNNAPWTVDDSGNMSGTAGITGDLALSLTNTNTGASDRTVMNFISGSQAALQFIAWHNASSNYLFANPGQFLLGTGGATGMFFLTANSIRGTVDPNGNFGIETQSPDRLFHVEHDSATTNAVTYVERLTSTSSGTPAVNIGVGMEFEVEAQAGVNKVGGTIESYAYNVGAGTEGFETVFKTMSAGAAATEKGRTGFMPVNMIQNDSLTLRASNSMVVSSQYTIPASVNLTMSADSVMRIL